MTEKKQIKSIKFEGYLYSSTDAPKSARRSGAIRLSMSNERGIKGESAIPFSLSESCTENLSQVLERVCIRSGVRLVDERDWPAELLRSMADKRLAEAKKYRDTVYATGKLPVNME